MVYILEQGLEVDERYVYSLIVYNPLDKFILKVTVAISVKRIKNNEVIFECMYWPVFRWMFACFKR